MSSSDNKKNEPTIQINHEEPFYSTESLMKDIKKKKNNYTSDLREVASTETLLKPEGNTRISRASTRESLNVIDNDTKNEELLTNKEPLPLTPSKTEIDKLITNVDDVNSVLLTVTPIDDFIEDEIASEVDDDMNDDITPIHNDTSHSKINKSINSVNSFGKDKTINDSISIHTEEGLSSKVSSQNQVNFSKSDLDNAKVEKSFKHAIEKELSFNYLDENEKLFNSFINKETLIKEYLEIRKRIEKHLSVSEQNKGLDIYASDEIENISSNNDTTGNETNVNITNDNNNVSSMTNSDIKSILLLLDKFMEKIIENEKINERYKNRMDELIALKNKLIGRQRIRNNKLEFALKEALFFLEKPFDVDLLQAHFIGNILSSFKDNPAELLALSNSNPSSNANSNAISMTAQAKKYLKKINKKHDNKSSNQNANPVLRISKEENELCMQFSINYLRQALDWIEKDVDMDDNCEKFKIKRYISVDKIPKQDEPGASTTDTDNNNSNNNLSPNKPISNSSSDNNINVSYSQIKINYQKGPSTEELTNEINLDDYFENPEFNNNKKHTLKKSSTFRKDKNGFYPELSSFTKSKSVNSLFIAQYGNSEIDFSNEQLANEKNKIEENKSEENINEDNKNKEKKIEENKIEENKFEENKIEEKKIEENKIEENKIEGSRNEDNKNEEKEKSDDNKNDEKHGSSSSVSQNSYKSNKSSHKNIPILITPLNADSEYNHITREGSDSKVSEKEQRKVSSPSITHLTVEDLDVKRSLSLDAKEAKMMSAKLYNNLLRENNMINIMIPIKNDETQPNDNETNLLQNNLDLLSNYKYVNNSNLEELQENFDKHFSEDQLTKDDNTFYFSINGEDGMVLFKKILRAMNQNGSEIVSNLDKTNFVTSIEYNEQLKKIEALEKENKRLNYQLEKKTLEYDHEHMAKVMLDKELEDLTSQLFLQANKLVETECHKLEDTKIKLKELNDKYNTVKTQLEKRENELNGLKKMMIKNEEKKVPKRTKMFPNKYPTNTPNALSTSNATVYIANPIATSLDKYNTTSITNVNNSEEVLGTSFNSTNSKPNSMENSTSYMLNAELNNGSFVHTLSSNNKTVSEGMGNDNVDGMKAAKEINNITSLNSDTCSETMDVNELNENEICNVSKTSLENPSEDIQSWNLYSTKVIALQNDKIFSYIDGGQFNEFQNYIRDSLIKVNNNKKKKSNIFCLPNTSFMKRCIEDEIYPCLFEHCSDQQSSNQSKRNSITKTHVNFKKKLQKALSCNGVMIIPYELLNKNGKLIKATAPVVSKEKQVVETSSIFDEDDVKDNETTTVSSDTNVPKKIEYYLEYDFVHPLPLPPRKKCCLCMNYRDCHYHIFFKNLDSKEGGTLTNPINSDSSKLVNSVNIIVNNTLPNTQDNALSLDTTMKHCSIDKDLSQSPTVGTTNLSQNNKKTTGSNNDVSPMLSPISKTVEDYTAKCYNINSDFLHQLRTENNISFNEQFFLCPICRDKIVSVADLYSYLSSLESKLTGSSKGQSSILNMFKNVILLKRRIATAKLGALQFFEINNDLFKDESLSALYDNSSEEWENYVKII